MDSLQFGYRISKHARAQTNCAFIGIHGIMASSQISERGYSVTFADQVPEEIDKECPICQDTLFQPKMVSCCGIS